METAAEILLIIVSSVLAVFLILLSIALIFFIRFLRRADHVANSVESAATAVRRSASAMPLIRLVTNIISRKRGGKV
ncbi:MAG TPA: hypothetical protein VLE51_01485 [Candidatus Saccharimonadales bacterium]|nr:hypothetical protein [Candidatus Saccharimonadales bacterium]